MNNHDSFNIDREIDACGLTCPLPILRARKALSEMSSGQILRVLSTDVAGAQDFASFAAQTGNTLVAQGESDHGVLWFLLRRK
ncbi:MAG: sulfurtransferase TusA family protein [Burkholderiales bacterium]|jgi:tRNA 2-thiouridine synthesizing protein A|nr:sulfurtransferase TusA family protein [Burkholderiales bacterium]